MKKKINFHMVFIDLEEVPHIIIWDKLEAKGKLLMYVKVI